METNNRKNILFISDHPRLPSGVGKMTKSIIGGSAHVFNWYCLGGNVGNLDQLDDTGAEELDPSFFDNCIADDPEIVVYPHSRFGNYQLVKTIIKEHDIDCVLVFGDPHNFYWLAEKHNELKEMVSLAYYHVWDNLPIPDYNQPFYNCFDWIGSISRLTHHIVHKLHDGEHNYVPHGINSDVFYPITEDLSKIVERKGNKVSEYQIIKNIRKEWLGERKFVIMWCNRNLKRKNAPDIIKIFSDFVDTFSDTERDKFTLLMKTDPNEREGANLVQIAEKYCSDLDLRIMPNYISDQQLNWYYNIADVTVNIANREGFGLTTLESLMAGTPISVNVTGGLQDQCGFQNGSGDLLTYEDYEGDFGSNSSGKYQDRGDWVSPTFPSVETISGTQTEPYCFDHYVAHEDVVNALRVLYVRGERSRKEAGIRGRTYAMKHFSDERMVKGIINGINKIT